MRKTKISSILPLTFSCPLHFLSSHFSIFPIKRNLSLQLYHIEFFFEYFYLEKKIVIYKKPTI